MEFLRSSIILDAMSAVSFAGADLPIRDDLLEAHERAWAAIARPGTWLTGKQRGAAAAEIRHAAGCALCARIKAALSPNAVPGTHDSMGELPPAEVELVHRVVNDPGRLSESWLQSVLARGLSDGEYVEIVGLIAMVMVLDTCHRALGLAERALPAPVAGEPSRYRPAGAKKMAAWLPFVEAVVARDAQRTARVRARLRSGLGEAGLVDAAAITAAFHGFVRIADATGIPYTTAAGGRDVPELREEAGINEFYRVREA